MHTVSAFSTSCISTCVGTVKSKAGLAKDESRFLIALKITGVHAHGITLLLNFAFKVLDHESIGKSSCKS